ncbi:MAG TPA: hypothetical protein VHW44_16445 [Pseudonocardiaceae bacterium]|nr:hypothetical protein [Pseudonocardiaceae bacterium]
MYFTSAYFCYLDESGGTEPPDQGSNTTPAMTIAGFIVNATQIPTLTKDFLNLKRAFFPSKFAIGPALDHVLVEIKEAASCTWAAATPGTSGAWPICSGGHCWT